ncbi:Uncharacterised protein [Kluyvera cryocrescens]|uniref:Uncharacterized protein n=1 Tax=Kluyvera cryocrescens TaxID=580 RepID=A0A485CX07_KLUCR|nr:Uncharacterised protein [Kluyvera cryocrescens]
MVRAGVSTAAMCKTAIHSPPRPPFANLIDERGEALHTIEDEMDRIPVFTPRYST